MGKPRFTVPYGVARVGAILVNGVMFYGMLYICGAAMLTSLGSDPVVPLHAGWLAAICLSCVPLFAAQSAMVSFPDLYALGFFRLPDASIARLLAEAHGRSATNPWRPALWMTALVGLPVGALSVWLVPRLPRDELTVSRFLNNMSLLGALLASVTLLLFTGRSFLREAAVLPTDRRYPGTAKSYLWRRHVIPQMLLNVWLNAWVAPALVRGTFEAADSGIGSDAVLADVFGTGMILAIAIGIGTVSYVRFDQRWRVAPAWRAAKSGNVRVTTKSWTRSPWLQTLLLLASPAALTALVYALLLALKIDFVRSWPFTIARGSLCGLFSGGIALWLGRWALVTPERARPGEQSHRTSSAHLGATVSRSILKSRDLD